MTFLLLLANPETCRPLLSLQVSAVAGDQEDSPVVRAYPACGVGITESFELRDHARLYSCVCDILQVWFATHSPLYWQSI